jgi:hypothetical protein
MSTTTAPVMPSLTPQQATVQTLLQKGLTITSTATPALNGIYAVQGPVVDGPMQRQCNAILLNTAFADGTQTLNWPDTGGSIHAFDVAQFKTFLTAVYQFVAQCMEYSNGQTTTAPTGNATIP